MNELTLYKMMGQVVAQANLRGVVFQDLTPEKKLQYANECVLALSVEVGELASSWPFASWKTGSIDRDNISREIIDCFFFLINIAKCFDFDAFDLQARFEWVLANNLKRMASGEHKEVFPDTKASTPALATTITS